MSEYRTFMPTEEMVDTIRKNAKKPSGFFDKETEIELCVYCMQDHTDEKISDVMSRIQFYLATLKYDANKNAYAYALARYEEDEKHEIWYCGREYKNEETDDGKTYKYVLSKLTHLACVVKTPDWFSENEKYADKEEEISSTIEYFMDTYTMYGDFEVINLLKDCEIKEDDAEYNTLTTE